METRLRGRRLFDVNQKLCGFPQKKEGDNGLPPSLAVRGAAASDSLRVRLVEDVAQADLHLPAVGAIAIRLVGAAVELLLLVDGVVAHRVGGHAGGVLAFVAEELAVVAGGGGLRYAP